MGESVLATVQVKFPDGSTQRFLMRDGQNLRIGRDIENDVIIHDAGASRFHASLSASESGVVLADHASLNGTYINGLKIHSMRDLNSRDSIEIGTAKITVHLHSEDAVDVLSKKTASRAMTAQMKPVSVSVMVATIADFNLMIEKVATGELAEMQFLWVQGLREQVREFDGKVDKVIGPSLVAVWVGHDPKNQALRAARAMQKVQSFTLELARSKEWADPNISKLPWRASVVLTSGLGLKGALGADSRQSEGGFTLLGDPINTAFALEEHVSISSSKILIDNNTAKLIQGSVGIKPLARSLTMGGDPAVDLFTLA